MSKSVRQLASTPASETFGPLVDLLTGELQHGGGGAGLPRPPENLAEFTPWYLAAIQHLEDRLGEEQNQRHMVRSEVELQCRLALSAANLGQAIELCAEFARLLSPRAGRIELDIHRDRASFRLDSLRQRVTSASSLVDITGLFAYFQLFQWLAWRELPLKQVRIGPLRRQDVLPFLRLFRAPVLAGGEGYALDLPLAALRLPVLRTPAEFPAFFAHFPCAVFGPRGQGLAKQVGALLAASVQRGGPLPAQPKLAADLGLSLSTFRLRLRAAGTSYSELRAQALRSAARNALRHTDRSIGEIALQLGFADTASFRRAFARWHGLPPTAWRARHGATPGSFG